jgi:hypothetical protein
LPGAGETLSRIPSTSSRRSIEARAGAAGTELAEIGLASIDGRAGVGEAIKSNLDGALVREVDQRLHLQQEGGR